MQVTTEQTKNMAKINSGKKPMFSDAYFQESVARRTAMKRNTSLGGHEQTTAQSQHPPMEIDWNQDEQVPCSSSRWWSKLNRRQPRCLTHQEQPTDGRRAPKEQHNTSVYIYRDTIQTANQSNSKKLLGFLHLSNSWCSRSSKTCQNSMKRHTDTQTQPSQQQKSSGNIRCSTEAGDSWPVLQQKVSKIISLPANACQILILLIGLRKPWNGAPHTSRTLNRN